MTQEQKLERAVALGRVIAGLRDEPESAESELRALLGDDPAGRDVQPGTHTTAVREADDADDARDIPPASPDNLHKRSVFEAIVEDEYVLVHLDATRGDVDVPKQFDGETHLVLQFGYGLSPSIDDMYWDDDGLWGTLTFGGGVKHRCDIPWGAVFLIRNSSNTRAMAWPKHAPAGVFHVVSGLPEGEKKAERPVQRPTLRVVRDDEAAPEDLPPPPRTDAPALSLVTDESDDNPNDGPEVA